MPTFTAILLMAGRSLRLAGPVPKQYRFLGESMLYKLVLERFELSGLFDQIVLVTDKEIEEANYVLGGETRQESAYKGILACNPGTDYVVIHDVARPFVSIEIIKKNVEAVVQYKAVNTALPAYDTINQVESGFVRSIPDRTKMWRGQTPQSFSYELIKRAHEETTRQNATDDCSLVLDLGHPVFVIEGSEENFKITTPFDALLADYFLATTKKSSDTI